MRTSTTGTTYGSPAPMPAPAPDPVEGREPDEYGVAVGDLVAGTCVTDQTSAVGVVLAVVPYTLAGISGSRYRVRCGALQVTGEAVERVIHDHPIVMAAAGRAVRCAACKAGEHATAERFVDCLIAHVRAEREGAAA